MNLAQHSELDGGAPSSSQHDIVIVRAINEGVDVLERHWQAFGQAKLSDMMRHSFAIIAMCPIGSSKTSRTSSVSNA